jgi:GMP reductase
MRIEDEVKLDFSDVLIRPKRSTLSSRKNVDLNRNYTFKHSGHEFSGVPIMASNMDGVGTFDMVLSLQKFNVFTCLVKSYNSKIDDWLEFTRQADTKYYAVSTGISEDDFQKLKKRCLNPGEYHLKNYP